MGRNKIRIQYIKEDRIRNITFNKRKAGLLKKACELSILCNINVVLSFADLYGNVYHFMAPDASAPEAIKRLHGEHQVFSMTTDDYPNFTRRRDYLQFSESVASPQPIKNEFGQASPVESPQEKGNKKIKKNKKLKLKIQIPVEQEVPPKVLNRGQEKQMPGLNNQQQAGQQKHEEMVGILLGDMQKGQQGVKEYDNQGQNVIPSEQELFSQQQLAIQAKSLQQTYQIMQMLQAPMISAEKNNTQVQTTYGLANHTPRIFYVVDINAQFPLQAVQPPYYQPNYTYSNLPSAQSNMSYLMQQQNVNGNQQQRPNSAFNFSFDNDMQAIHLPKQQKEDDQQFPNKKIEIQRQHRKKKDNDEQSQQQKP